MHKRQNNHTVTMAWEWGDDINVRVIPVLGVDGWI